LAEYDTCCVCFQISDKSSEKCVYLCLKTIYRDYCISVMFHQFKSFEKFSSGRLYPVYTCHVGLSCKMRSCIHLEESRNFITYNIESLLIEVCALCTVCLRSIWAWSLVSMCFALTYHVTFCANSLYLFLWFVDSFSMLCFVCPMVH